MEIHATTFFDYDLYKTYYRFSLARGKYYKAKTLFLLALVLVMIGVTYWLGTFLLTKFFYYMIFFVVMFAYFSITYFLMPKIAYQSQKKTHDGISFEFVFTDEEMKIKSINPMFTVDEALHYELLFKIYETQNYIYLFIRKRSAYIVKKSDIIGDPSELTNLLQNRLGKKYIKCN